MENDPQLLVVAAHPDDESLGCAGTISLLNSQGWNTSLVLVSEGISSQYSDKDMIELRYKNFQNAAKTLNIDQIYELKFPDAELDIVGLKRIVTELDQVIKELSPDRILSHSRHDPMQDHNVVSKAVELTLRPRNTKKSIDLWEYEIVPALLPNPNTFIELPEKYMMKKLEICGLYQTEFSSPPHPRSIDNIENLMKVRGSQAGYLYSEAFEMVKQRISYN